MPPKKRKRTTKRAEDAAQGSASLKEYSSDGLSFGDEEDDLPDLNKTKPQELKKFRKDDVVWAPYEDIYWPAVVTSVRDRYVRILWVNEARGHIYKKKASCLISFDDDTTNYNLKQSGEKKYTNFKDAYELVTKYFIKKSTTTDTISARRYLTLAAENDALALDKDTLYRLGCNVEYSVKESGDISYKSSESEESDVEEDESIVTTTNPDQCEIESESLPELDKEVLKSLREEAEELLPYIQSENCFKYLEGVRNGDIDSFRHSAYPKAELLEISGLGPFTNHADLTEQFLDIIENICEKLPNVEPSYKLQVLIPEAIIFSLMQKNTADKETANAEYRRTCSLVGKQQAQ